MSAPPDEDYYTVLGVHVANDAELRRAWRTLAAQYHPDRAGLGATPFFQRLSCAYEVLSNPAARAAYDRKRGHTPRCTTTTSKTRPTSQPQPAAPKPSRPEVPAVMLSRLCGSLMLLQARGAAHLNEPGYITLVFNHAEAAQGGMIEVSMNVDVWVPGLRRDETPATRRMPPLPGQRHGRRTLQRLARRPARRDERRGPDAVRRAAGHGRTRKISRSCAPATAASRKSITGQITTVPMSLSIPRHTFVLQ